MGGGSAAPRHRPQTWGGAHRGGARGKQIRSAIARTSAVSDRTPEQQDSHTATAASAARMANSVSAMYAATEHCCGRSRWTSLISKS